MKVRSGWGNNFMEKFYTEGGTKGSEPDAKLTPATKTSGRRVQSAKKLTSVIKTASRCSSQQVKQEAINNNKKKLEEMYMENPDVGSINKEDSAAIDITKIMHSMKRGKRSARNRVKSSAPWVQLRGFLKSKDVVRAHRNDQGVGSKMMKKFRGGTKSLRVYNCVAKGKKNIGAEEDASNQSIPAIRDEAKGSPETNAAEQVRAPKSDTSSEFKEQCGVNADECAFKQIGVPTGYTSSQVKISNGANEISHDQTVVLVNNTLIDFNKSKGAVANNIMQTTNAINLNQAKENNSEFASAIFSGRDPNIQAENFDISTAKSAPASLYDDSMPDSCVEFAIKLLTDETPLPAGAAEVEEFFRQKIYHKNSPIEGPSQSSRSGKD